MKHKTVLLATLFAICFIACKTPQLELNPELNHIKALTVKGRNGLQIGQIIRFGEYKTDKVRRGWTGSYDVPFITRFSGAKEKLSFTQFGPEKAKAEVACVSRFRSVELPWINDFFQLPLVYKNYFAGHIALDHSNWAFILHNPNGDFARLRESAGYAQNGQRRIDITAIRGLKGQPDWMKRLTVFGHEFSINGKVVGAVSTVNRGEVWIDESLDTENKTIIAALSTGILLRRDVEEAVAN